MLEMLNNELEQRVAERTEELRQREEQFRSRAQLLELATEAIVMRDMNGNLLYWNSGAEGLYGWKREEVLGKDLHTVLKTVFPVSRDAVETPCWNASSGRGTLFRREKTVPKSLLPAEKP